MSLTMKTFKIADIRSVIKSDLNPRKALGYDEIPGDVLLKEIPDLRMKYISLILNAFVRLIYIPFQWEVAQIIPIPKLGKSVKSTKKIDAHK